MRSLFKENDLITAEVNCNKFSLRYYFFDNQILKRSITMAQSTFILEMRNTIRLLSEIVGLSILFKNISIA